MAEQRIVTPTNQHRYVDPYEQRIFNFPSDNPKYFLGFAINQITKAIGNDILLEGFRISSVDYNGTDPSLGLTEIKITIDPGICIVDSTIFENNEQVELIIDVGGVDPSTNKVIVYVRYMYLHFVESGNRASIVANILNTTTHGVSSNPFPWDHNRDRLLLAVIEWTVDGSGNVNSVTNIETTSPFNIEGKDYKIGGGIENYNLARLVTEIIKQEPLDYFMFNPLISDPSADPNHGILYTKDDSGDINLYYIDNNGNIIQLNTPGGGASVAVEINQPSHGFSVGDAVYLDESTNQYAKALANDPSKLGVFIVSEVIDSDNFKIVQVGRIEGLSGLTPGKFYYVSDTTPGQLVDTEPSNGYSNPILLADSTTSGFVLPWRASTSSGTTGTAISSANAIKFSVNQSSHGFSVGEAIYFDETTLTYQKAISNDINKLGLFIVSDVIDADNFECVQAGLVTGLSGLTAGKFYFVSDSTPGQLVDSEPDTGFSNPILLATSNTSGYVLPFRASGEGSHAISSAIEGYITGLYPIYNSSNQIDVAPGVVWINGVVYKLSSQITLSPSLTASSWHYIYISSTPSSRNLNVGDFIVSTTAHTRTANGWYDGSGNRCVGFFYVDSTPVILKFDVSSWYMFNPPLEVLSTTSPPMTLTALNVSPPVAPIECWFGVHVKGQSTEDRVFAYIENGSATSFGIALGEVVFGGNNLDLYMTKCATTDESGNIKYAAYCDNVGSVSASFLSLKLFGLHIPNGMGC